jgi:hypothetical protein
MAVPSARELYAVCQRATLSWKGGHANSFVGGMIEGIPFVLPTGFGPSVATREGEDVVVPLPLPVCDRCWKQLDGGTAHTILSALSQAIFIGGVVALTYMIFAKMRGDGISLIWPLCLLACAIPPYFLAERIRSRWGERLREYVRAVPQYDALLNAFPDVELLTRPPTALMESQSSQDNRTEKA